MDDFTAALASAQWELQQSAQPAALPPPAWPFPQQLMPPPVLQHMAAHAPGSSAHPYVTDVAAAAAAAAAAVAAQWAQSSAAQQVQRPPATTLMATAPATLGGKFTRLPGGWPPTSYQNCDNAGIKIHCAEALPGAVRHDVILTVRAVGRLIGPSGENYKRVAAETQCGLFIIDKEPPPGES